MATLDTWMQTVQRDVSMQFKTPAQQNFSRLQAFGSVEDKIDVMGTSYLYRWKNPAEWEEGQPQFGASRVPQVVSGIDLRIISRWFEQRPIEIFEDVENINITDFATAVAKYSRWVFNGRWKWWDKTILDAVSGPVYTETNGTPGTKVFPNDSAHTLTIQSRLTRSVIDKMVERLFENMQNSSLDNFAGKLVLIIRASDWTALRDSDRAAQFASNQNIKAFDKEAFMIGSPAPYYMFDNDQNNMLIVPVPNSWLPPSNTGKHYIYAYNQSYLPRATFKLSADSEFLIYKDKARQGQPVVITAGMRVGATRAYDDAVVRAELND